MDKPKEFWIAPEIQKPISDFIPMYRKAYDDKGDNGQEIHVIEYSAYEQLQKRFEEAKKILEFYAEGVIGDNGHGELSGTKAWAFLRSLDKDKK